MRKRLWFCICLFVLIEVALLGNLKADGAKVIVFDISKSMVGFGDGMGIDIFEKVKEAAEFSIRQTKMGNYLFIYPFHAKIEDNVFERRINTEEDILEAIKYLRDLEAIGYRTHLTRSYSNALNRLKKNKQLTEDNIYIDVLIFTDGKGNGPDDIDPITKKFYLDNFIKKHRLIKSDIPFLYTSFIAVGDIFTPDQKVQLKQNEIELSDYSREEYTKLKLHIAPDNVIFSSQNKEFNLKVQFSDDLTGEVLSLTDMSGKFEIVPKNFILDKSNNMLTFLIKENIEIRENSSGEIHFKVVNRDNIIITVGDRFLRRKYVLYEYIIDKRIIHIDVASVKSVKNYGKISLLFTERQSERVPVKLLLENISDKLQFELRQTEINASKSGIGMTIEPTDKRIFRKYRRGIKNNQVFPVLLTPQSQSQFYTFSPEDLTLEIEVTKTLPLSLWFIQIALICLAIYILYKYLAKPHIFKDLRLRVLEPPDTSDIDLRGKNTVKIGRGGDYFNDANATAGFCITARNEANRQKAVLQVDAGIIVVHNFLSGLENQVIGEGKLYNGDTIKFDSVTILVESFSIQE